jgi:protein involved in polysaccharide export with SLBB domain
MAVVSAQACQPVTSGVITGDPPQGFVDTTLGPGDVFSVKVFGEEALSGTFRVEQDGFIYFPLIGKVRVGGETPSEVGRRISRALRQGYLRNPQITIFVTQYNSKKITVFGQVKKPGIYLYTDNMTIIQAITEAGDFTDMADRDSTIVTRMIDGRKHRIKVPVKSIGEGKAQNVVVRPGDVIWVPERLM